MVRCHAMQANEACLVVFVVSFSVFAELRAAISPSDAGRSQRKSKSQRPDNQSRTARMDLSDTVIVTPVPACVHASFKRLQEQFKEATALGPTIDSCMCMCVRALRMCVYESLVS